MLENKVVIEWFQAEPPSIPMWRFIPMAKPSSLLLSYWLALQVHFRLISSLMSYQRGSFVKKFVYSPSTKDMTALLT